MDENEIIMTIYNNNSLIFIEEIIENIRNLTNITNIINNENNLNNIIFDIEITHLNNINQEAFKTCKEINQKICKAIKIKSNDDLLKTSCLICMEDYKENEYKRIIPNCNHVYHKKCIDKWLKKTATCPVCRTKLL
jgi:hypothetical protein